MSWANADGGTGSKTYILQLDKQPTFNTPSLLEYADIESGIQITSFRVPDALDDDTQYLWRAMAIDEEGQRSDWGAEIGGITARYFVRSTWNDGYYGPRLAVKAITTSPGTGVENIQDYDESSLSAWTGEVGQERHWVQLELDEPTTVTRIWLLFKEPGWKPREQSGYSFVTKETDLVGRPTDYEWQYSGDGKSWLTIPGTQKRNADGYRAEFELEDQPDKPTAIFLTGFGRWDEMIPQFEFNGEYEIIRESDSPILGACGGLQPMAQQDGFMFAMDTGRYYGTRCLQAILDEDIPVIDIHEHEDPFFEGMVTPFYGPEFHSWAVSVVPDGWQVLATLTDSNGVVVPEVMSATGRIVYGTQSHPEIAQLFSASKVVLNSFLRMAVEQKKLNN